MAAYRQVYDSCHLQAACQEPLSALEPYTQQSSIGRVGRAMVSQCTKYEVSRFTRYEAVNGGAKCSKWGGLGG